MNFGKSKKSVIARPGTNQMKRWIMLGTIIVVALGLILWVASIGKKAEAKIQVVMLAKDVYKNQSIDETMIKPYSMVLAEYEKYAIKDDNGTLKRRIVAWSERDKILGAFSAYPLQTDTLAMYRNFIKSRVDNSDSVLYSFPGKDITRLNISNEEMEAFKTFLKPGDRLNIECTYIDKVYEEVVDGYGQKQKQEYEVFKSETLFGDILVADLLNTTGESVLDMYTVYKQLPITQQAQLDRDKAYKERTTPKTLLAALTPEEKERYFYFLSKNNVSFKATMPQRIDR